MRRMLVNAQKSEQLRVAVIDGNQLESYQMQVADRGLTRGNIYRGIIANIEPSLNAAFIDYGFEKHGFLPIQDVVEEAMYNAPTKGKKAKIEDVLSRGRPIVVQVSRDPEGKKGAALTTNLSLAGRYLVLTPFDNHIGVSRKVDDDDHRKQLKAIASKLELPEGCGVIVRTNATEETLAGLRREVKGLLRLWKNIGREARVGKGTKLLYEEGDLVLKAFRDSLDSSVKEVLVDAEEAHEAAADYMKNFMPRSKTKLVHYTERKPLFAAYGIESQIEAIYQRSVPLPSGGSLVVDVTEALTAIDVNSGRATKGTSQEETAYKTNLEAAAEVGRQLRLRDIGGLVVVDFIDMRSRKYQRKVESTMKAAMKPDAARSSVGRISSNGLLEINRQKIRQELLVRTHRSCPTCDGTGRIASPELVGLSLLRRIEARAANGLIERVRVELHPELADAFQNGRRRELASLETEFQMEIDVISSPSLHRAQEEIEWTTRSNVPEGVVPAKVTKIVAPRTAPSVPEDEPSDAPPKRRRRRGGRRRTGGTEAEASGTETASVEAADSDSSEASEPSEPSRSSRRRRGGRRGRGRDATTSDNGENAASNGSSEVSTAESSEAKAAPPKRRRGGRSGRRGKAASEDASAPSGEAQAVAEPEKAPAENEAPRRRGRRGRSVSSPEASDAKPAVAEPVAS